ncbi:OLC1v1002748C2 [Oldenlandia corymbosa var. corymbosa]|uniref:OLC1v1002748C2 n=1 Tax=Oldenlandia corymbosa var. corymbosa TaxID=529605 RepID=A0AAV1DB85_OLDCO|nr:OLC1v1002748C2 [Oldenlandia corymbosa var. corymbosa]
MQELHHNNQNLPHGSAAGFGAVNGGGPPKRFNVKAFAAPLSVPPGHVCFRLLCHASRVGGIIGKSGSIIRQLQLETSAKIRVEDSFPNSDDHRVIVIVGRAVVNKKLNLNVANRAAGEEEAAAAAAAEMSNGSFNGVIDAENEVMASAAQEAVLRVFERVIEVAAESDGLVIAGGGGLVSCRLLVEKSRVGSVIGKGGKVIENIKKDTGCRIKVLASEKLSTDEMVEIEGDIIQVKKALIAVSRCLQDCIPSDLHKARMMPGKPVEAFPLETSPGLLVDLPTQGVPVPQATETSSTSYSSRDYPMHMESNRVPVRVSDAPQHEVVFRILCLNDRVGTVIGIGGSIVRALQAESNAIISVGPTIPDCEERLITVTAMENQEARQSPAQNAIKLISGRIMDSGLQRRLDSGTEAPPVCARLVVHTNQVGCLLGKGGTIVSEMRKATGAAIRILGGDQVPRCASQNDEVVQIMGEFANVQDALYHVTGRLRNNLFVTKMQNGAGTGPFGRGRDQSLPGFLPPVNVSDNLNQQNTLTRSMNTLSLSENVNQTPSLGPRTSQAASGIEQRNLIDGRGLTSPKVGVELGSGSRSAIVTNTTVEIVVPENVIDAVYGDNGGNLVRLRQVSYFPTVLFC